MSICVKTRVKIKVSILGNVNEFFRPSEATRLL